MEVLDQEYDVHKEQYRAQVALHNMNFNSSVETLTQYLIRFNEIADNNFPEKGQEFVENDVNVWSRIGLIMNRILSPDTGESPAAGIGTCEESEASVEMRMIK